MLVLHVNRTKIHINTYWDLKDAAFPVKSPPVVHKNLQICMTSLIDHLFNNLWKFFFAVLDSIARHFFVTPKSTILKMKLLPNI